jgi:hypothetical protein
MKVVVKELNFTLTLLLLNAILLLATNSKYCAEFRADFKSAISLMLALLLIGDGIKPKLSFILGETLNILGFIL